MKIHEYQSREILKNFGIPTSQGGVVFETTKTAEAFKKYANPTCMAKVQVLMGGRGKAGGVVRVSSPTEAQQFSEKFLGKLFSTYQSGGESKTVKSILITEDIGIKEEYYLGIVLDRSKGLPVVLFSKEGGVEIEDVAAKKPSAIKKVYFSPNALPTKEVLFTVFKASFSEPQIPSQIAEIAEKLAKIFVEKDAAICEINPLVLSTKGQVLALDAKIVFDDNALFRHPDIQLLKDPEEEDERERKAKEFGLSYVSMAGNVGCLVNGAGLAMATMDVIKLAGGEPANFLDVGGGATTDQVREGFKIILQDERVEAILVNIFGGIVRCDRVAQGIVDAYKNMGSINVPIIIRLQGTNAVEAKKIIDESGLKVYSAIALQEAADLVKKVLS